MIFLDQMHLVATPHPAPQSVTSVLPYPSPSAGTTGNEKLESVVRGMTRTIHLQDTDLSLRFFSVANVQEIQNRLRDFVRRETGYTVERQSDDALLAAMRHVYVRDARNNGMDVGRELARLNSIVLSETVPLVITGLTQYLAYLRDASRLPPPLPRPLQTSIKGSKTVELFRPLA
jgi:hypothetical protein